MNNTAAAKRLVIIDGKSVFYRGYYAMSSLATKDGTPTGGVFGFASMALEVVRKLKPDYVCVAWDKPKTNIRKRLAIYPEYKAGRKPAPADFYEQVPILQNLLAAFGWPLYELDDYEADDIMGALAAQASAKNIETMLVTSDMDMLQLIDAKVHVYALKKGLSSIELYSPESFEAKYTIKVDQFLDMKSLKGDASDNIPGVPGIGEKGAIELLQNYKTLDGVYENLALVKDSLRKKLEAGKDSAYMSKELARIYIDAPIKLDLAAVDGRRADPAKIQEIFQTLQFRSLARQLPQIMRVAGAPESRSKNHESRVGGQNIIIDSNETLRSVELGQSETIFVHSRAAGGHGREPQVLMISADPKKVYTFDLTKLDRATVRDFLTTNYKLQTTNCIGYDVKSTLQVLLALGCQDLPAVGHDVLVGAFLLNSLRREQTLTELAQVDLDYQGSPFEDLEPEELTRRAPEIMATIQALYDQQKRELVQIPKLVKLAAKVEWPVIPVLARMEYEGIELDVDYLKKFAVEIDDAISDLEQQIYGYADREFNISSPAQLADILFNQLNLPKQGIKKTQTGYSTAASELDKLRAEHPIIELISQYREVTKLKNTYVDALPKLLDAHNRLHTTFNLTIAQTGRLSSTDPNLQNIPVRTPLGKRIRTAFVAGAGNALVSADYSQFELRLAAAMSGDQDMIDLFNRGTDIHAATAAQIQGRELEDVTKQMRSAAKTVNFGVLYGMSPHGLSAATGMTFEQSRHFIDEYFKLRGPLLNYLNDLKERARKDGYVETIFGRRRPMPDIHSSNFIVRSAAERAAINMPIQGTEADLMKLAMVAAHKKLRADFPRAHILLQIHDSILVECPQTEANQLAATLKTTMEKIYKLPVKLDVDVSIGQNWGEL